MATGANGKAGGKGAPLSLKGRALALLAQREHSAGELRRKLLRHARAEAASAPVDQAIDAALDDTAIDDDAAGAGVMQRVDAVMAWLSEHHYLSEERFIESRVHARAARYGNLRIRQELAQHGLSLPPVAAQALKESEFERAGDVWRRKFGAPPADAAERARQSRFLAQRGFSPEVISRLMREAGRGPSPADPADPD